MASCVIYCSDVLPLFLKSLIYRNHKGKGDLAERMFRYFYKISDRYKVSVTAVAILADGNKNYRPKLYVQEFMGTSLRYSFNSYKILDQDESTIDVLIAR